MLDSSKIVDIVLEFLECQLTSKMDIFLAFLKNFVSDVDGLSCALGFRFANCQVIFSTKLPYLQVLLELQKNLYFTFLIVFVSKLWSHWQVQIFISGI